MTERLSLIAGSGALVSEVVARARQQGYQLQMLSLHGRRTIEGLPAVRFDIANPEPAFAAIRAFGATAATMAGSLRLTDRNREALLRLLTSETSSVGDSVLSALAAKLTQITGARLLGVHEIVPELLAPEGQIGGPAASPALIDSATFAVGLARSAGQLDLGQAAVVSGRRTIALEDIAGTDALLKRVATYRRLGLTADGMSPLVLAKVAKPGQPLFVDLPAIGPRTVVNARRAGIAIIAVQAGATLLIERQKLAAVAASARMPIVGFKVDDA
jgi:DUF1009 family protein